MSPHNVAPPQKCTFLLSNKNRNPESPRFPKRNKTDHLECRLPESSFKKIEIRVVLSFFFVLYTEWQPILLITRTQIILFYRIRNFRFRCSCSCRSSIRFFLNLFKNENSMSKSSYFSRRLPHSSVSIEGKREKFFNSFVFRGVVLAISLVAMRTL